MLKLTWKMLEDYDPHAPEGGRRQRRLCPYCGEEKPKDDTHRSLVVETATGLWICHRCGRKGKLWTPDSEERREWKPRVKLGPPAYGDHEAPPDRGHLVRQDWREMLTHSVPIAPGSGAEYLLGRGLDPRMALGNHVRFLRRWFGRPAVLFPIRDCEDRLVAVQGRYTDGGKPKARTAGDALLGVYATQGAWLAQPVVLVEGPIDALTLAEVGVPAIATFGCRMPDWLPERLSQRLVVVATDNDPVDEHARSPGNEAARAWTLELVRYGADVARWQPPLGSDWNDLLRTDRRGLKEIAAGMGKSLLG